MGRRGARRELDDDDDDAILASSGDEMSEDDGDNTFEDDPDLAEEARLFRDPTRKRRKFTKEQAIYGIFGDDSEDGGHPGRKKSSSKGLKGGIRFVRSSTPSQPTPKADASEVDEEEGMNVDQEREEGKSDSEAAPDRRQPRNREEEEDDESGSTRTHFGLGFGGAGLGSSHESDRPGLGSTSRPGLGSGRPGLGSFGGFGSGGLPTSFGTSTKPESSRKSASGARPGLGSAASSSGNGNGATQNPSRKPEKVDPEFAKFEKQNKGIALQYMQKMGYKIGEGLGKGGSGIVEPIEVKVRPSKMGLGANGFDETTKTQKKLRKQNKVEYYLSGEEQSDEDVKSKMEEQKAKQQPGADSWKKSKKSRKVTYRTALDIVKEQEEAETREQQQAQKMKIIDMTGKQTRVLEDLSEATSASHIAALKLAASNLMELRYNVRMLVSESETELIRLTKAMHLEQTNAQRAKDEEAAMNLRIQQHRQERQQLAGLMAQARSIKEIGQKLLAETAPAPSIATPKKPALTVALVDSTFSDYFQKLQDHHYVEYFNHGVDAIVMSILAPILKRLFIAWDPLADPDFAVAFFHKWRKLFRRDASSSPMRRSAPNSLRVMSPYENLLHSFWLPKLRQTINNDWSALHPEPLISFLERWYPNDPAPKLVLVNRIPELESADAPQLIPPWIHHNIIKQLILPKVKAELESWSHRGSKARPHVWIFPWLPVLKDEFETLREPIRIKLSGSLGDWHPRDSERAIGLVTPWSHVLPEKEYHGLLNRAILPKLVAVLRNEFTVNPAAQEDAPLRWVLSWHSIIPDSTLCHLLETEFFPKWIRVLWIWLSSSSGADRSRDLLRDISRWYAVWKTFFPIEVAKWEGVSSAFRVGLELMRRRFVGEPLGSEPPAIIPVAERSVVDAPSGRGSGPAGAAGAKYRDPRAGMPELLRKKALATSFEELLERTADAHGLAMLPTRRTHGSGKAVFRVVAAGSAPGSTGGALFYVDEGVLFAYQGGAVGDSDGVWSPVAIDEFMATAKRTMGGSAKAKR
ncbi:GC-rich sequence DNA-binding factor-like protein-domain-containing protein [Zopfochytrium polystomum]|nr:GC-rich sequence DNA-binding factor-like protein-domain-containing protein [Zopfochytrium polystomum]